MSYDLEIGTHGEPTYAEIAAWAEQQELAVERDGEDGGLVVSRPSKRGDGHLFALDGPFAAEPDDFAEEVAASCLAPRWMTTVAVPYSVPKRAIALARALARHLAETNDGAAFDPQIEELADGLFVRLGDDPRPVNALGAWPLPAELSYRFRPYVEGPGGSMTWEAAQPDDAAEVIPPLSSTPPAPPSRKVEP